MADALEDDFVPSDVEYVDDGGADSSAAAAYDDEMMTPLKKRKANGPQSRADATRNGVDGNEEDEEITRARKKQKLKQKDKARKAKKAAANLALEPGAISRYPTDMQADHLRKLLRSCKVFAKMTDLELDDVGISEAMLIDTSSVSIERKEANLTEFIRKVAPQAVEQSEADRRKAQPVGSPSVIVISGNAQRAADLARAVRTLLPDNKTNERSSAGGRKSAQTAVAKLFARHFKIAEQAQFLAKHVCPLAVGTPQRLEDLLKHGLSVTKLACVVLDASWTDAKQRTLLDGLETRQALFSFLSAKPIRDKLQGGAKVCLF